VGSVYHPGLLNVSKLLFRTFGGREGLPLPCESPHATPRTAGRADAVPCNSRASRTGETMPPEPLDCNGNGRLASADVVWLFNNL
jgi:hypothetical protein